MPRRLSASWYRPSVCSRQVPGSGCAWSLSRPLETGDRPPHHHPEQQPRQSTDRCQGHGQPEPGPAARCQQPAPRSSNDRNNSHTPPDPAGSLGPGSGAWDRASSGDAGCQVWLCMAIVAIVGAPGGGLQAAGGGAGVGSFMALAAIGALAWLLLRVGCWWVRRRATPGVRSGCAWPLLRSLELREAGCRQQAAVSGRVVCGLGSDRCSGVVGAGGSGVGRGRAGLRMCVAVGAVTTPPSILHPVAFVCLTSYTDCIQCLHGWSYRPRR